MKARVNGNLLHISETNGPKGPISKIDTGELPLSISAPPVPGLDEVRSALCGSEPSNATTPSWPAAVIAAGMMVLGAGLMPRASMAPGAEGETSGSLLAPGAGAPGPFNATLSGIFLAETLGHVAPACGAPVPRPRLLNLSEAVVGTGVRGAARGNSNVPRVEREE